MDVVDPFSGFWAMSLVSGVLGVVLTIGLIALVILGVRWFIRQDQAAGIGTAAPGKAEDPLEILRRRYAAGEIDEEEYERRRRTLAG